MLRQSVIYHTAPTILDWIFITAAALSLIVVGYMIFLRLEPGFAEEM
jgi:ABC-type polysaccharide/polyol phosphate export permease